MRSRSVPPLVPSHLPRRQVAASLQANGASAALLFKEYDPKRTGFLELGELLQASLIIFFWSAENARKNKRGRDKKKQRGEDGPRQGGGGAS